MPCAKFYIAVGGKKLLILFFSFLTFLCAIVPVKKNMTSLHEFVFLTYMLFFSVRTSNYTLYILQTEFLSEGLYKNTKVESSC